jgi:hypothetical protein
VTLDTIIIHSKISHFQRMVKVKWCEGPYSIKSHLKAHSGSPELSEKY